MKKVYFLLTCILTLLSFNAYSQLSNGLISYWKMDETSGSVLDALGLNSGTVSGAVAQQSGKISYAYTFDGINDYISIPNSTSLNIQGNAITLSAWVKPTENKVQMIVNKIHAVGTHVSPYFQYNLQLMYSSAKLFPRMYLSINGTPYFVASDIINMSNGVWYFVTGTYDGTTMRLYLNGTQVATTSVTGNISPYSTPVYIGVNGALGEAFKGSIDEVGIWNRALTSTEVSQLYNSGSGLAYPLGTVAVTGISVAPTSASVAVGGTTSLTATISPSNATNQSVTWYSSNPTLAQVNSSGLVTGISAGTATINAVAQENGMQASSTITVSSVPVAVTVVTLAPTSVSVPVGSTSQLAATVAPANATNKTVSWVSDNTNVAIVNSTGLITGVTTGTATITVTTADGNKTATCAVTVTAPEYANWLKSGNNAYYNLGKVSIGTSIANSASALTVDGKILAKEVEVVSSIASDYVFEPEFELMPLTELEIYLKKNKHLPGIPSALEFKNKGQNLGEMDDMLLRKIEELTLYILSQEEKIMKMEKQIEELSNKGNHK